DLRDDCDEQYQRALERRIVLSHARNIEEMEKNANKDRISKYAVIELHRQRVLEKIPPQRGIEEKVPGGGNERTVDQRPGIVDQAGAQTRHQCAKIDLRKHENEQSDGSAA